MEHNFKLNFLDHVAIRVKDLELSVNWYQNVLGLRKYKLEKWGEFPIFMLLGKFGVALFPSHLDDDPLNLKSNNVKIDHFAFNVNHADFKKAKQKYTELGLDFEIQDHYYFDSIYTKDPDGHIVELTTLKVDEDMFYGK